MSRDPRTTTTNTERSEHETDHGMASSTTNPLTDRRHLLSGLAGVFTLLSGCGGLIGDNADNQQVTATRELSNKGTTKTKTKTRNKTKTKTKARTKTKTEIETTSTPTSDEPATLSTDTAGNPKLTTYTSQAYGYRIKYPSGWSVNKTLSREIVFRSDSSINALRVRVVGEISQQLTLSQLANSAISNTRERMLDFELLKKRKVTISSGQSAYILEFRYDNPNDRAGAIRSTYLITRPGSIAYEVEFFYVDANYTGTVEQLATTVIDSFAITGRQPTDQPTSNPTTEQSSNESLDLSSLTTYTNDRQGYRIKHPTHWRVRDDSPTTVVIANRDGDVIRIMKIDMSGSMYTSDGLADSFIQGIRETMTDVSLTKRRNITLPNGQSALILHGTYDSPNDRAGLLRTSVLFTIQQDTAYKVGFVADASDWTPAVKRTVTDILTSFTYSSGTSV